MLLAIIDLDLMTRAIIVLISSVWKELTRIKAHLYCVYVGVNRGASLKGMLYKVPAVGDDIKDVENVARALGSLYFVAQGLACRDQLRISSMCGQME